MQVLSYLELVFENLRRSMFNQLESDMGIPIVERTDEEWAAIWEAHKRRRDRLAKRRAAYARRKQERSK